MHTNRELLDWRGRDRNPVPSPPQRGWLPVRGLRAMRQVEYLLPGTARTEYPALLRKYQSVLITREPLLELVTHHPLDLGERLWARGSRADPNPNPNPTQHHPNPAPNPLT